MDTPPRSGSTITAETLIRELQGLKGAVCARCHTPICHHQVLMSCAFGFKNSPHCLDCFAAQLNREVEDLRRSLLDYVHLRDCYRAAWQWATQEEKVQMKEIPACSLALEISFPESQTEPDLNFETVDSVLDPHKERISGAEIRSDAEWDAGAMACGDLVLELRLRFQAMPPGHILKLCASDSGAPEDLPAWCRLTGHRLLCSKPPNYWIKRKE